MWYLYLDESGDLGFDFVNKKPSKFFTICILAMSSVEANRQLSKAVHLTLRRKLNAPNHRKRLVHELKGTGTTMEIKKYFYDQVKDVKFAIYAVTLNKRRVYEELARNKSRVYNFVARLVLDQIPFEMSDGSPVTFIIDKSMAKPELAEFNTYIGHQLKGKLPPKVQLRIEHRLSHDYPGLQAADLFAWGIFQKYERGDTEWYQVFSDRKVEFDSQYL